MSKILGSWSGMRKYLEQEMTADSLKGRVQYSCTSYPNTDDKKIFEIRIDGKTFKRFSWETVAFRNKGTDKQEAWSNFWQEKGSVVLIILWILAAMTDISYISVIICFVVFLVNDLYGFISWKRMSARQNKG